MEGIIDNITQPSWWITVVVAGIIVNILAAYIRPVLDGLISRFLESRKAKLAQRREERERQITRILESDSKLIEFKMDMSYTTSKSILLFILMLFIALISSFIFRYIAPPTWRIVLGILFISFLLYPMVMLLANVSKILYFESVLKEMEKRKSSSNQNRREIS